MKELKDIVLKKGDIVYFSDGDYDKIDDFCNNRTVEDVIDENYVSMITKIERLKYETIYEAPKQILTEGEKEYLENVIRPFRDRVIYIQKRVVDKVEYISCRLPGLDGFHLPDFKKGTLYKGMKRMKEYTLKELGLFE